MHYNFVAFVLLSCRLIGGRGGLFWPTQVGGGWWFFKNGNPTKLTSLEVCVKMFQ